MHAGPDKSHTASYERFVNAGAPAGCALRRVRSSAKADEIQLKDGKTFYGVIVAYDNNMFKVKTDFGFILVEKEQDRRDYSEWRRKRRSGEAKPGDAGSTQAASRRASQPEARTSEGRRGSGQPSAEPAVMSAIETPAPRVSNAAVRPAIPASAPKTNAIAPSIKAVPSAAADAL